jgi:hypothetical protein
VGVKIQIDGEIDEGELDKNQPKTTRKQLASHILRRAAPLPLQIDRSPGESDESRSAKVRGPSCDKQRRPAQSRVSGVDVNVGEELARVIEGHQDHQKPAQHIDRFDAKPLLGPRALYLDCG